MIAALNVRSTPNSATTVQMAKVTVIIDLQIKQ